MTDERGDIRGARFRALAAIVWERARERGLGHVIPREWLLQGIRDRVRAGGRGAGGHTASSLSRRTGHP
ncbi:hypothetical protein ACIQ6K_14115 [Streptomyces sp. NPDC096354]|uniref:hypothetical protein n=1 Tax=Streptomyces sp. NPDC096354 TaxID=3366088 RepID=UPI0037F93FCB